MKKMIMALVCATMSMTLMAQPKDKKENNRQPRMEQGCHQQGCPMERMQAMKAGDAKILKQLGVDSTKIKQVKDLKKKNREARQALDAQYNKDLRKLLGDDTYIKFLEAKVAQGQVKAKMHQNRGMKRQGMRQGQPRMGMRQGRFGQPRMGMPGQRPMKGPGMQPGQNMPGKDGDRKDVKDKKGSKDKKDSKDNKSKKSKK